MLLNLRKSKPCTKNHSHHRPEKLSGGDEKQRFCGCAFHSKFPGFQDKKKRNILLNQKSKFGKSSLSSTGSDQPLVIDKSAVIIVEKGGILIPSVISQDATAGKADDKLLTLIALEGNIFLDTGNAG
jgi:hypothetical protein